MPKCRIRISFRSVFQVTVFAIAFLSTADAARRDHSDLNSDGAVDLLDVEIFALETLNADYRTVDWCTWLDDKYTNDPEGQKWIKKWRPYARLLDFIEEEWQCAVPPEPPEDPFKVKNELFFPARVVRDAFDQYYVSDPRVGSVFIYNGSLELIGELSGLSKPLGVEVGVTGEIFVASDTANAVQVYDTTANKDWEFGKEWIQMPTDLLIDNANNRLYVVDSKADTVWIFTIQGAYLGSIGSSGSGPGQLSFPTSIAYSASTNELFVADQKNHRIQVFDFDGNFLRSLGSKIAEEGWFNPTLVWEGRFGKIQSLSIDALGRLHALDTFLNRIQILDPSTGAYQSSYNDGAFGSAPGELNLPLDFVFDSSGGTIITDAGNSRVQRFMVP